ncbi:MAG: patatin-like phospholipase family protein, partial [Myxococcota bacterium]
PPHRLGVAAMVALGWDLPTMTARNRRAFVDLAPFQHWTLPFYSMIQPDRIALVSKYLYGDARIEDLWLPMFCVSCDLLSGAMNVHRTGPLAAAVLATTALPGVLPPVLHEGKLLVDGGVMDNNPVAVMRELGPGPVVLIDVGQAVARLVDPPDLPQLPSNPMAAWHRFKWFGERIRVPTIPEIVARTMTVARPNHDLARISDLYVRPPVDAYGMTDFARQDELVAIGYDATLRALRAALGDPERVRALGLSVDRVEAMRPMAKLERGPGPR